MEAHDYLVYTAFILFLAMITCYLVLLPTIYKLAAVSRGTIPPWDGMEDDSIFNIRLMFVTTTLFWITLWTVKLSFLALYKKLMRDLPKIYIRAWWSVLVFCLMVSTSNP
jgi:hypothetical protein